jgi:hypothetical protein
MDTGASTGLAGLARVPGQFDGRFRGIRPRRTIRGWRAIDETGSMGSMPCDLDMESSHRVSLPVGASLITSRST